MCRLSGFENREGGSELGWGSFTRPSGFVGAERVIVTLGSPRLGFITGMACSVEMESDCSVIKKQACGSAAADGWTGRHPIIRPWA